MDFGKEKAVSIQLLSMRKKKQPDGFYHCESQLLLGLLMLLKMPTFFLLTLGLHNFFSSVVKWLKRCDCDRHDFSSEPTRAIMLSL